MLHLTTAQLEQDWNREQFCRPITECVTTSWTYSRPGIVFGPTQRKWFREIAAEECSLELVDRDTGGGVVFTGPWMLSVSLILPAHHPVLASGPIFASCWFGGLHQQALERLDLTTVTAKQLRQHKGGGEAGWACFGTSGPGECFDSQGRKIVGIAQRVRTSGTLLSSATLLTRPPWEMMTDALYKPRSNAAYLSQKTTYADCKAELFSRHILDIVRKALKSRRGVVARPF